MCFGTCGVHASPNMPIFEVAGTDDHQFTSCSNKRGSTKACLLAFPCMGVCSTGLSMPEGALHPSSTHTHTHPPTHTFDGPAQQRQLGSHVSGCSASQNSTSLLFASLHCGIRMARMSMCDGESLQLNGCQAEPACGCHGPAMCVSAICS